MKTASDRSDEMELSTPAELSTTEAADLLGVSRTTLVGLLKDGHIPHRTVGTHRRVPRAALLEFRKTYVPPKDPRPLEERRRALEALLTEWRELEKA